MTGVRVATSRLKRLFEPLGLIVALVLVMGAVYALLDYVTLRLFVGASASSHQVVESWINLASIALATYIMLRLQKRPWADVMLERRAASPRLLVKGVVLGSATIGLASAALYSIQMLRITPSLPGSSLATAGRYVLLLLPAAFFEELLMRGYIFSVLRRAHGWKMALIVTSLIFGGLHAWNPGADPESILAVTVAGFFLGMLLLATRSLYAAGAAHFAWNWVMAGGMHIAVSGLPAQDPDYRTIETGPDWLTGGAWGPEGGIAAVIAMFVAIFYLYGRYLRRMELKA